MRRSVLLGALVAVIGAVFAATAGARVETRFSVIAQQTGGHQAGRHFVTRGRLLQPGDRDDVVGHYRSKFGRHGRVHAVALFGDGAIKLQGNTNASRIPIVGGRGRWNGAAGKVKTRNLRGGDQLITFVIVQ
jgi:hypothetical protein